MKVGTRTLLFGVHQVFLHPWFVAAAWTKLYGWRGLLDLRLWVCFFIHDVGYFGKANIDGYEGERHVQAGAEIASFLFDHQLAFFGLAVDRSVKTWYHFCLFHSRFYARQEGVRPSRLCAADKIAITLYPWWFYLALANLSGEIKEYMNPNIPKYREFLQDVTSQRQWFAKLTKFVEDWVENYQKGE